MNRHRSQTTPLIWIALEGPTIDAVSARLIDAGAGGVVLFSRNLTSARQCRELVAELRARARGPFRVAIDHEGGHVARLGAPLTRWPSAMALGATGSEELAEACARAAGRELRALGIDVNLAPVLEVAADPRNASVGVRAFGSDSTLVARLGAATVRGLLAAGIAPTAKHFPGHGRTNVDPHHGLPIVPGGLDVLRRHDLPPFRAALAAGTPVVMTTHAAYDGLTGGRPATVVKAVMNDLLRDELAFDGLAITDALDMDAISAGHDLADAAVGAVVAGADVVMPLRDQERTLGRLEQALHDGELSADRLSTAVARAQALDGRIRRAEVAADSAGLGPAVLPEPAHAALAAEIGRASLSRLPGGDVLPLEPGTAVAVVEFPSRRPSPIEERSPDDATATLGGALARRGMSVREVALAGSPEAAEADRLRALAAAEDGAVLVVATRDAFLWPEDRALVDALVGTGRPVVHVALRNPWDLAAIDGTRERIAAYGDVPATVDALADAMIGRAGFPGSLPMRLELPAVPA